MINAILRLKVIEPLKGRGGNGGVMLLSLGEGKKKVISSQCDSGKKNGNSVGHSPIKGRDGMQSRRAPVCCCVRKKGDG